MVTKAFLAKAARKRAGISYEAAAACIDAVIEAVNESLAKGETIELRGFGSFSVKTTARHQTGVNGQMIVPVHGRVVFRPAARLRRAVWNSGNG